MKAADNNFPDIVNFLLNTNDSLYENLDEAHKSKLNQWRYNNSKAHLYPTQLVQDPSIAAYILTLAKKTMVFFKPAKAIVTSMSTSQTVEPVFIAQAFNR